jgi:hypothetical protein
MSSRFGRVRQKTPEAEVAPGPRRVAFAPTRGDCTGESTAPDPAVKKIPCRIDGSACGALWEYRLASAVRMQF